MSTDTVISERATHLDLHEPDDQWEAELKEKLSVAFNDMLRQAKQKLEDDLNSLGGDNIDAAQKKKLIGEYQASERQIKSYATQSFRFEVEKEREQRRWAAGLEMRTGWKEDLENEQMAIMSGIRRQRTGSAGAESNANPKGRDRESTQPDRLSDSRQQTTTTTTTPTPSATRPSPIPIPTVQRRSSTSGTPVNSVPKNPEVWIPPKSAAEDKPNLLGRRTSQASIRTSPSQNFRPSAPIPENQKPSSNTDSRSSSSHVSKACAPLPEIPKDTATENDHSESRTASSQTSRPSVSTLENRNHYGNLDRDSRSSPSYTLRSENNRRSIPEHDSVEHQTTTTGPVIPIHEHANAEREKARMAEADQLWASHTRAKGKEIEIERDRPSSPLLRSVSNQDVGPPPPPPIATKPVYTPHPSLLTTSRPSSTASSHPPATLRQVPSFSDGPPPHRQPSLDTPSPSSYRQPSLDTSPPSLSRQPSLTFSSNNSNHHPHPRIPEFPPPLIPVDGSEAYRSSERQYTSLQSPSHSQTLAYTYGPSQMPSHPQRQPFPPAKFSNLYPSGGELPAWQQWGGEKHWAELSDDGSESFSEDDEAIWSSHDTEPFAREEVAQDDMYRQEATRTMERPPRREAVRGGAAWKEEKSRREEEARKEEALLEMKRKEEENKRNEMEALRKSEEAQRKADEARKLEEEAERKAEEARRIEAETEKKAAILRAREEALRQREQDLEKREREALEAEFKRKDEELKRREEELAKKEAEDLKRRQEESERREAEAKQKAEQERLEEEAAKAREKQQIQKDKELAERLQREQNESSWKEKERADKIRMEADRKKAEEKKKADEKRKAEERRKLEEFQMTQARARRKEEEARQQQADFQRREEEIRRKRQDSWTSEDSKARSASGWGSSASASSSGWGSSPTASNPTSGWKPTTPNSSRTSTSSSTPGYKPRSGSTSSYSQHQSPSTPSSTPQTPVSDAEWRRRQEEQARAQQEKFRTEQERLERERQAKEAGRIMSKDEVVRLFQSHESQWQKLTKGKIENVIWDAFPWPMIKKPKDVADINAGAIQAYVLNPHFPNNNGKGDKDKIKEQIRRWHPDRFERLMPRVAEGDRDRVREGGGEVVRGLNDLLTKVNGPAGVFG